MNEFVLVLTLCSPGAWNNCSSDYVRVEKIEHIQSESACNKIVNKYMDVKYTEGGVISAICIPVVRK